MLINENGESNGNERHRELDEHFDKQNGRGRKNMEEYLDFFLDNIAIEEEK